MKAVIFHKSWFDVMENYLTSEERLSLLTSIRTYAIDEHPQFIPAELKDASRNVRLAFILIRGHIDADVAAGKYKGYEYDEGEDE